MVNRLPGRANALYLFEWQTDGQGNKTWTQLIKDTTATAVNGGSYDYQVTYDPTSGVIDVYRDKVLRLSYTDSTPLTSGSYIGLRTINTRARFDDVQANEMALSYLHSDHLGSNSLMTDAAGTIIPNSQAAYLPFGDWRNEPNTADLTDVGYTGHKHNNTNANDLGLIYMNARYYVPSLGRFASADTIIPDLYQPQSYNRFSYVLHNPLRLIDPTGHWYYEPSCDCLVDTDESYNEDPSTLERAFTLDNFGNRFGNTAEGYTIYIPQPNSRDAWAIGLSFSGDTFMLGPLGISVVVGGKIVVNPDSSEISIFAYGGYGGTLGMGANGSIYYASIYDLTENQNYRGPFLIADTTAAVGILGGSAGGFISPDGDIRELEEFPNGTYVGYSIGANLSASVNLVEYIELVTYNWEDNTLRVNMNAVALFTPTHSNLPFLIEDNFITIDLDDIFSLLNQ